MARPLVMVKQGWLRGAKVQNEYGESFISFNGIPFAEPPIGDLRFKDPQPKQLWSGVREAVKEESQCMQRDEFSLNFEGDEDCLYLNVTTTSLEGSRPVMVWFHGGAFLWGNGGSNIYGPDYLVKMDVVFVSINYRLGVFGFLQLEHEAATGNMGLKDQVEGLKWVKENIAQFGGDPNNVTIFGESAGAASVHYHLLSPLSKGLFHKAIIQSGVALNPWACAFKPVEIAHRLVVHLGKETTDPDETVEYLRTIPADILCKAQEKVLTREEDIMVTLPFGPSVDSKSATPFLPRSPHELIEDAQDIPIIIGYNNYEGIIVTIRFSAEAYPLLDEYFEATVARALPKLSPSKALDAAKEAREFYLGEKKISKDEFEGYIKCLGDLYFNVGINEVVEKRAKNNAPTYFYRFSHNAPKKLSTHIWHLDFDGAGHFDEIAYLFYQRQFRELDIVKPDSIEEIISKRFVKMWTDFAKFGNPTPLLDDLITVKWKPVSPTDKNCLEIDSKLSAEINPDEKSDQFWRRIRADGTDS